MSVVYAYRRGKHNSLLTNKRIEREIDFLLRTRRDMSRESVFLYLKAKFGDAMKREIYFCHNRKCTYKTLKRDCAKRNRA